MRLLAIDPGNNETACVTMESYEPLFYDKSPNGVIEAVVRHYAEKKLIDEAVIEMVASYGMPVGAEVFDTCVEIGRLQMILERNGIPVKLMKRHTVKMNICHSARANDATIIQALVDRFAPGQPNRGKGNKKDPGFFYGFKADIWQAYALGVTYIDKQIESEG